MIKMDSKAQLTVDVVSKVAEGKIDIVNAAKLLNKSRRTIERYLKKYRKIGIQFVVHQNTGKPPANKTSGSVKRAVQSLIKEKYFDVNLTHLRELLQDNEGIQVRRETLRSWVPRARGHPSNLLNTTASGIRVMVAEQRPLRLDLQNLPKFSEV